MPVAKTNPEPADIYAINPTIIPTGDAHNSPRPVGVVAVVPDYVKVLGRSASARHIPGSTLASEIDLDCGLDKRGVFDVRFKHSIGAPKFSDARICDFRGHLAPGAATDLLAYWDAMS